MPKPTTTHKYALSANLIELNQFHANCVEPKPNGHKNNELADRV